MKVKVAGTYVEGALSRKTEGAYQPASLSFKRGGVFLEDGEGPPPGNTPSLDFSDPANSQYLALISVGGL